MRRSARAPFGSCASTSTRLIEASSGRQHFSPQVSQRRSNWGASLSPFSQELITLRSVRLAADIGERRGYPATAPTQPCNECVTNRETPIAQRIQEVGVTLLGA